MKRRPTCVFDLDDALADHAGQLVEDLNALAAIEEPRITLEDLAGIYNLAHGRPRIDRIRGSDGWWSKLRPIDSGMRVFHAAQLCGFSCTVLTRAPKTCPNAWTEKALWCLEPLGEDIPITVTTAEKGQVRGEVLFDDNPDYCKNWLEANPNGLVIMPVIPQNRHWRPRPDLNVLRYDGENFEEVVAALKLKYLLFDLEQPSLDRMGYDASDIGSLEAGLRIRVMLYNLSRPPVSRSYQEQYDLLRLPDSMRALEDLRMRLTGPQVNLSIGEFSAPEQRFIAHFPRVKALFER